jgi:hypothetical protein
VHCQTGGRGASQLIDVNQFNLAVMHVSVVDAAGCPHPDARVFGNKDGTRQLLQQDSDRIPQIEHDLLDD